MGRTVFVNKLLSAENPFREALIWRGGKDTNQKVVLNEVIKKSRTFDPPMMAIARLSFRFIPPDKFLANSVRLSVRCTVFKAAVVSLFS